MPPKALKRKSDEFDTSGIVTKRRKSGNTIEQFFKPLVPVSAHVDVAESGSVQLNEDQRRILSLVVEQGKSVFFTGSAGASYNRKGDKRLTCTEGTGKSLLLRAIIAALKKKYAKNPHHVAITASTGMAASNVGGA